MKIIYISGQYRNETIGGTFKNIMQARDGAVRLWNEGWVVVCPHLNTFLMDGLCPDSTWLNGDLEIIRRCDAIFMLSNWQDSKGARMELEEALKIGLEIYWEGDVKNENKNPEAD